MSIADREMVWMDRMGAEIARLRAALERAAPFVKRVLDYHAAPSGTQCSPGECKSCDDARSILTALVEAQAMGAWLTNYGPPVSPPEGANDE